MNRYYTRDELKYLLSQIFEDLDDRHLMYHQLKHFPRRFKDESVERSRDLLNLMPEHPDYTMKRQTQLSPEEAKKAAEKHDRIADGWEAKGHQHLRHTRWMLRSDRDDKRGLENLRKQTNFDPDDNPEHHRHYRHEYEMRELSKRMASAHRHTAKMAREGRLTKEQEQWMMDFRDRALAHERKWRPTQTDRKGVPEHDKLIGHIQGMKKEPHPFGIY